MVRSQSAIIARRADILLALGIAKCHRCDGRMRLKAPMHLQAGGAGRAIDENAVAHRGDKQIKPPCKDGEGQPAMMQGHGAVPIDGAVPVETDLSDPCYVEMVMSKLEEHLISELLDAAIAAGADGADAGVARSEGSSVSVRLGKVEASERAEEIDAALRVFVGKRNASVSTSQLDSENIRVLADRAVAMAKVAPEDPYVRMASADEIAREIPQVEIYDEIVPSTEQLTESALAAENAAVSVEGITNSEGGSASHGTTHVMIATSNGFSADYRRSSQGISAVVIAEKDGAMERDYDYTAAVFGEDLDPPEQVGASAAERTLSRLGPRKPETGQFPVVYHQRVAGSLVGTMAGAINGAAIARGTSFLKDSMGEQVTSPGLTFIDDPLRPRGMASRLFDGEGLPVQRRAMVEDGVLKSWFLDIASATKLGLAPNGQAARGMGSAPVPGKQQFLSRKWRDQL